ncbi:DJ-1/PfpI family protein [Fomes fomentarius]|nr:DJ-1/PfpI family protein [Fomes fomentarius]
MSERTEGTVSAKTLLYGTRLTSLGTQLKAPQPNAPANLKFGVLLFPAFEPLDVYGPIEALQMLSKSHRVDLHLIASSLDPISTALPESANTTKSLFETRTVPTHTFDTVPDDLDVLLVPGGAGTRAGNVDHLVDFIRKTYPKLKYLLTVCTGAGLVARSGILDGKSATTNKARWKTTTALAPRVNWVKTARYVVDGNFWTSGGVSAGIDVSLAWIEHVYGKEEAREAANRMEYEWRDDKDWDPFSYVFGEGE